MKKTTIEGLLTWAFVEELALTGRDDGPEGFASSSYAFDQVALLGCMVDGKGTPWDQLKIHVPHPDAVEVARAVTDLSHRGGFDIISPARPFPDWLDEHGVIAREVGHIIATLDAAMKDSLYVANLVISCAVLGKGPDWEAIQPKVKPYSYNGTNAAWFIKRKAKDSLGRVYEYEDDGFDYRKRRPMKGAYHKYRLTRSIRGDLISRLDWQLWQSALQAIHESVAGRLQSHDLVPFIPDPHPWAPIRKEAAKEYAFDIAAE